jgi:hypothetical protein
MQAVEAYYTVNVCQGTMGQTEAHAFSVPLTLTVAEWAVSLAQHVQLNQRLQQEVITTQTANAKQDTLQMTRGLAQRARIRRTSPTQARRPVRHVTPTQCTF